MFLKFVRSFTSQSEDRDSYNRTMPSEQTMKSVSRKSISEEFSDETHPIPSVKHGGARVRVYSAGACYTDQQVVASGQRKPRLSGVQDTSLFPGYELSGLVDEICSSVTSRNLKEGDRVVLYCGDDDEDIAQAGYAEFVSVNDVSNLVKIPDGMNLDVAAMLPCGALTAYAAVERAKPFIEERLKNSSGIVNVLIVGAGGLGLWILRLAEYYIGSEKHRVRIAVADTSAEKLELAKRHGSTEVIHWQDSEYEEYIVMRTKNACKGGVDVVIDFVSSQRTIQRALTVLKQDGIILVGGNSKSEVVIDLHQLSIKGQTLIGVHKGTRQQLEDLVEIVASGQIVPPVYQVFPVEQATEVFKQLSQSKINGRAVLRVYSHGGSDSVFFHESNSQGSFPELGSFTNSNNELDHPGTPDSSTCSKRPFFRQNSPILEDTPVPLSKVTFSLTS